MRNATIFRLGDTVSGYYHEVPFTGVLEQFDAVGFVVVRLAAPITVCRRTESETIGIDPRHPDRLTLKLVSRPEVAPEVRESPCGGCYLVRAA